MKALKKVLAAAAVTGAMFSGNAQAIAIELGLVIDASGSISSANYALQRSAYASALNDPTVLLRDGSIAVGVWQFATGVQQIFPTTIITDATIASLIAAITGMTQPGGSTATGPAITAAYQEILGNAIESDRQVIDVSTDGANNVGISDTQAALNAIAAGIDAVNCLGIGAGAVCDFETGVGSFEILTSSFDDFEAALRRKLVRETQGTVPEPGTALLAGLGLLGLGFAARRKAAQK